MKKIILLVILSLLMVTHVHASCEDGTEITGLNGHVYCRSNIIMNWYTAFAWCEAHGRTLATMEQLCDINETQKWDGGVGNGKCLNIVKNIKLDRMWAATPYGTDQAFELYPPTDFISTSGRIGNMRYALCW